MANDPVETVTSAVEGTSTDGVYGIVRDGVVGAAGGFVGTALLTVVLLVGQGFGAFEVGTFASLAVLVGLSGVFSPAVLEAVGYLIFLAGGMTTWPLLFASLEAYLPGRTLPERGLAFGTVLWTGFALAFYTGQSGGLLVLYLIVTLVAHWAYGFGLGAVFDYLSNRPETLV